MDEGQLRFILEELQFSSVFPNEVLRQLAETAEVRSVAAGVPVFREGTTHDYLYLVHTGCVALEMCVPGRGTVRLLTVGPGEMVGWSALLHQNHMTASAVAVETSQLVVAPADKLRALCETSPEFGMHLMRRMAEALSRRLTATRLQLLDLFANAPTEIPLQNPKGQQ